jgi:hypothetical protein
MWRGVVRAGACDAGALQGAGAAALAACCRHGTQLVRWQHRAREHAATSRGIASASRPQLHRQRAAATHRVYCPSAPLAGWASRAAAAASQGPASGMPPARGRTGPAQTRARRRHRARCTATASLLSCCAPPPPSPCRSARQSRRPGAPTNRWRPHRPSSRAGPGCRRGGARARSAPRPEQAAAARRPGILQRCALVKLPRQRPGGPAAAAAPGGWLGGAAPAGGPHLKVAPPLGQLPMPPALSGWPSCMAWGPAMHQGG